MDLQFTVDMRGFRRGMDDIAKRQLPFATAQALTATAGRVGIAWQDEMRTELDRPTPFTINAVGVRPARKSAPVARVYVKDIAAQYLSPYVDGGPRFLGRKRGLLTPKAVPLNAYGNLTKRKLATLKARRDVFVGPVRLKSGQVVNGVWQRQGGKGRRKAKGAVQGARALQLLIRFSDPTPPAQRLDFRGRAEAAVHRHFEAEFAKSLAHALATAR